MSSRTARRQSQPRRVWLGRTRRRHRDAVTLALVLGTLARAPLMITGRGSASLERARVESSRNTRICRENCRLLTIVLAPSATPTPGRGGCVSNSDLRRATARSGRTPWKRKREARMGVRSMLVRPRRVASKRNLMSFARKNLYSRYIVVIGRGVPLPACAGLPFAKQSKASLPSSVCRAQNQLFTEARVASNCPGRIPSRT